MLDSELHDRESHDNATGGSGAGDIAPAPAVPAAVFQPPQVVFQPPAARQESEPPAAPARPERAARPEAAGQAEGAGQAGSASPAGNGEGAGDDGDGTGTGRRRRRRSSRGRGRNGDQDAPAGAAGSGSSAEAGDGARESQDSEPGQEAAAGAAGAGQPESRRSSSRSRSRKPARGGSGGDGADAQADAPAAEAPAGDSGDGDGEAAGSDDADGEGTGASGRRRRRKRRRGSAGDGPDVSSSDDPPDTVVHVREPNGSPAAAVGSASNDVRSVKGSTRLEAKKQRRREGRETGRRRPPIVTESEFLARRESVERSMVVRQRKDRTQIAVLEDGVLVEHYVNRSSHQSYVGNVYLGKVQNVLPSMEAAFVDVGKGRNAVLYAGEVNFDVSGLEGQPKRIESALKPGQSLVVQVTKDPVGHKGARLTAQWEAIEKKSKTASAPAMLYGEPDLTIRVIRDVFNEDFSKLVVSGDDAWDVVDEYVKYVAPHLAERVTRWQGDRDAFAEYRIDEQLAKALERKVWLPSGGSLVIDKTEAMTVVDVNTGKFTGQGGNLEETVTRNNLEAAEEIVRQLRLRDVGGIVVIDFIDMVLESNRELVLRRLLECLSRDRTKHQVAEVTSLGLVQMTRKRVGAGLLEAFSTPCECCNGRGVILTFDPDSDGQTAHHTHSRGHGGNGGNGGNGGRGPSPASVAARARAAEISASASASAGAAPGVGAGPEAGAAPEPGAAPEAGTVPVAAQSGDTPPPADGHPVAPAQTDNGQAPEAQAAPARSGSGRRRRRKPAGTAAPAASPAPDTPQASAPKAAEA